MTGYGRGVAEREGRRAIVEIRSVNHRFLDLKLRTSGLDPAAEEKIAARVRAACERGSVTVAVRVEQRGGGSTMAVDLEAGRRVHAELTALARALGLDEPVSLALVCAQPGVLVSEEPAPGDDVLAACIEEATAQALAGMLAMREAEGEALARDLAARQERLGELVRVIESHSRVAPEEARRRLDERLARLLRKGPGESASVAWVDPARLAMEVALLADRLDVTEELVRLRSHLGQLGQTMNQAGAIGRRLDFLVQEIGREINTIVSKSQSAEIARTVVEAKAELEKVREQIQNIE